MKMNFEKDIRVLAPAEDVWNLIRDIERVVEYVPGANITAKTGENSYDGAISVKLGPMTTNFKGKLTVGRVDETERKMEISGAGMDTQGKSNVTMEMTGRVSSDAEGGSVLSSSMKVNASGRLAQLGSRMMTDVSNRMFEQFTENLRRVLDVGEAPVQSSVSALSLLFAAVAGFFRRLLGRG